ncbi:hypothetical protein K402DRAFT_233137 [Aulographum hederae CBS 113979]|uniref:Uncharacterized protein n=1 Tax=Aulographum hederae CBS 113979 TaxID=1176131 RepID=A0A6G1GL14_9PEZI|nr:hypothetical protein K402DRAFT_233137 [Aulographum hederae CBS 113979]
MDEFEDINVLLKAKRQRILNNLQEIDLSTPERITKTTAKTTAKNTKTPAKSLTKSSTKSSTKTTPRAPTTATKRAKQTSKAITKSTPVAAISSSLSPTSTPLEPPVEPLQRLSTPPIPVTTTRKRQASRLLERTPKRPPGKASTRGGRGGRGRGAINTKD